MVAEVNTPVTGPPPPGAINPAVYVIVRDEMHVITAVAIAPAVVSNAAN